MTSIKLKPTQPAVPGNDNQAEPPLLTLVEGVKGNNPLVFAYRETPALLLQHIHRGCCAHSEGTFLEGYWWFQQTLPQLSLAFDPPLSTRNLKYNLTRLIEKKALITANIVGPFSPEASLSTPWYRVNYEEIADLLGLLHLGEFRYEVDAGIGKCPTIQQRKALPREGTAKA